MEEILRIVMEIVATGVGVLLLILIKRAAKKYGFELKQSEEDSLLAVMGRIVLHVEEEAAKSFKLTSRKWESWRKFNEVFRLFTEEVPGHGKEKIAQLVNEVLVWNNLGATVSAPKCWPEVAGKPPGSGDVTNVINKTIDTIIDSGQSNAKAGEKVVEVAEEPPEDKPDLNRR